MLRSESDLVDDIAKLLLNNGEVHLVLVVSNYLENYVSDSVNVNFAIHTLIHTEIILQVNVHGVVIVSYAYYYNENISDL